MGTDKNYSLWGGGSTTVVSPDSASNGDVILAELECVPSVVKYKVNTENSPRPRQNKRKAEEELLDPEEDEKRKMRRNRNRLAAARCRQKRLDRPDPHKHPEPLQPLGSSQGQLQPEHSDLREPGETTDSDGPPESQHPGSPHLTVTSSSHLLPIFINIFILIFSRILSSLVAQLSCSCTK